MRKGDPGFTIIEFLLAFVILSIALIAASVFPYASSKNLHQADTSRLATWKAIEKIERIKGSDYSLIQDETESITIGNISAQRITSVSENVSPSYKIVNVKVTWGNLGSQEEISLSTIIVKP
ncbi:MAG: prepilin-type N-terminal cleavage/methylation domain-containing protein [Candidatus Omnitrophica bacterium]|nr:prepilin-type N-terminal cleavage/methylation domain-containing protein [Candidatus Omnitrophota bacterium]